MLKIVVVAMVAFFCAQALAEKTKWHQLGAYNFEKYVQEFGKQYASHHEYEERRLIFNNNLHQIKLHNADTLKTWKQGVNHLTDRTPEEFRVLLGYKYSNVPSTFKRVPGPPTPQVQVSDLPASVDWREKGVITAVKDQGHCGSCWAFATAESVETHYAIVNGADLLTDLSIQQILDCTPNPQDCGGTGGCGGGTAELAGAKIMEIGGLSSEWTYPYVSYFGENATCRMNLKVGPRPVPKTNVHTWQVATPNDYNAVLSAVANLGPQAINVDASTWHSYESGVFDGCNQTSPDINHVVQLVGYGTDEKLGDYWLVRNSWSALWGEAGYVRLARPATPRCGTDHTPLDGTGCKGGPLTQYVCGTCGLLFDVSFPTMQ